MRKIYNNIIAIASVLLLATACSDSDFLDVPSQEDVDAGDSDEVYEPEEFVNGTYGMFTDWDYGFAYLGITEMISDNADKGSSPGDTGGDKNLLDDLTYTSTASSLKDMWTRWYKSIGRATKAIEQVENSDLTNVAYKNRLIGEAKFLRALNYFYLVRGWGDVTIQGVDDVNRASKADVYAYIEKDLLDAIEVLPMKSEYDSKDLGRATKGAAQSLLAKVYLYQQKWQEAYNYSSSVINSGQYQLETDYAKIWRASSNNGVESIFDFQSRSDAPSLGVKQYSMTQGARGSTGWGWGFNTPSENLLKAFNDAKDIVRRDATIIFRNSTLWDGRIVGATENPMYNYKAYSSAATEAEYTDKNIRYIRLGEIYLIQAEAANELGGKTNEALSALNKIRNRAKLESLTTTDPTVLRKAIWNERRLELAFEHDRWFDIVRTGEAKEAMKLAGKNFVEGKHDLFPIPNEQLINTPAMTQNPNW